MRSLDNYTEEIIKETDGAKKGTKMARTRRKMCEENHEEQRQIVEKEKEEEKKK